MEQSKAAQVHRKTGTAGSGGELGISALGSIRVRIIFIAMLAIMTVSVTQIIIFGSLSRKQFKDMVICDMEDMADSYQKVMNIRIADLKEAGEEQIGRAHV